VERDRERLGGISGQTSEEWCCLVVCCILSLNVALRLAKACLAINRRWSRMGPCFSGLLDASDLVAMLLGWCLGNGSFGVVWLDRLGKVGWMVVGRFSSGVGLELVGFVDRSI